MAGADMLALTSNPPSSSTLRSHLSQVADLIDSLDEQILVAIADRIHTATVQGSSVYVFGNGGSAATAEHFVTDLTHVAGTRALCLSSNVSQISATANDLSYEAIFARQLETWLRPGDVAIAISVSGRSQNCVRALHFAAKNGASTIGLLGDGCPDTARICTAALVVPSTDHRTVESVHMAATHAIANELAHRLVC